MAFYGDLGSVNAKSVAYLQEDAQEGKYDAILHVGNCVYKYSRTYANGHLS